MNLQTYKNKGKQYTEQTYFKSITLGHKVGLLFLRIHFAQCGINYNLSFSLFPAPLPLYFDLVALKL